MLKQKRPKSLYLIILFSLILSLISSPHVAQAQLSILRTITFPVIGAVSYSDDFGAPRVGHTHEGNDLMGKKLMPLVATVDGTVAYVNYPEGIWGYSIGLRDAEGYRYNYLHINNDNPGTDDGKGDGFFAYAPDMISGAPVIKGQLIGWMGDSGDAESTAPHLHFEIRAPDNTAMDPFMSLKEAPHIVAPASVRPALPKEILPYGDFRGGMTVAVGSIDGSVADQLVTGAGPGGGPLVRTFKKDGTALSSFYAYDSNFPGGVDVALGDVDGDGKAEIITAAGAGGGPHIRIFKVDGTLVKEFMAYAPNFHGGVNVTSADIDGDGKAEIITSPMAGGGPDIRIFKVDGTLAKEFMAYDPGFHGGVDVAATSQKGTLVAAIVTAPAKGGGPDMRVFNSSGVKTAEFSAYEGNYNLGVRVSVGNVQSSSPEPEIIVVPATGGGPNLKTFKLDGTMLTNTFVGFEQWWRGGYDLAAGNGESYIASGVAAMGGRRSSLRAASNFINISEK